MKKIILLLVIAGIVFAGFTLLKTRKMSIINEPIPQPTTIQVKVVSAETKELQQTRPFLAKLSSTDIAEVSSKLSGRIENILVKENQSVEKGELLLNIDGKEVSAAILTQQENMKAQKKDVEFAKSSHERNRVLFKSGGLAREKLDKTAVTLAAKKAILGATKQNIIGLKVQQSYLNIVAPFDGTVGTINLSKGSLASPGKPILSINSLAQKLTFSYAPGTIAIKSGQDVLWKGKKIAHISNLYSDADNGLSVAEVDLESPLALPNHSYITVDVRTFSGSGCRVPLNALILTKESAQLMVYKDEQFTPFPVTVVVDNHDFALVKPCPSEPVALGAAAKLSELPGHGKVLIDRSKARG